MSDADRERIAELLDDETRSFRSIARELGVSDWLVRKTARELYDDPRPMRQRAPRRDVPTADVSPLVGWLVCGGFAAMLALIIWAGVRSVSPPDSTDFSHGLYQNPQTERTDNETEYPE